MYEWKVPFSIEKINWLAEHVNYPFGTIIKLWTAVDFLVEADWRERLPYFL